MPTPGSMWNTVSIRSRAQFWSSSGMPSSDAITMAGRRAPKSCTKSNPGCPACASRKSPHSSRMRLSSAPTRRGVKARDTSARNRVWSGGSMKIIWATGMRLADINSRTVPCAELKVFGSRCAASTSSKRAERPEVVSLVAVDGCFVAHAPPDLVGVGVDVDVEGVVVEVRDRVGHEFSSKRPRGGEHVDHVVALEPHHLDVLVGCLSAVTALDGADDGCEAPLLGVDGSGHQCEEVAGDQRRERTQDDPEARRAGRVDDDAVEAKGELPDRVGSSASASSRSSSTRVGTKSEPARSTARSTAKP